MMDNSVIFGVARNDGAEVRALIIYCDNLMVVFGDILNLVTYIFFNSFDEFINQG